MTTDRHPVVIRELRADEPPAAIEVLGRGMRDNPGHVAVFGHDPERRQRSLRRMFSALFGVVRTHQRICVVDGDTVVGFAASSPPSPRTSRSTSGTGSR